MNQSHISNFTETIERTPSFYASLIIRRRNDRRERHKIKIDTTRVGRLPLQNTNNQSLCYVEILVYYTKTLCVK
ncbi:unnamed protein product [Rhizophagus irregularis]|nr:unnamed protein product [Rhizophagus irregularis]CAB4480418.1 unnamed protein product [Rhizophagus irregularis]